MKRFNYLLVIGLLATSLFSSCSSDDDNNADPGIITPGSTTLTGVISSSVTLTKDKVWTLEGFVYVTGSNTTLTIQPGTKIISKRANAGVLVITRGAKIQARGTAAEPIVFTSGETTPAPGDLGGVVVAGSAPGNGNHAQMEGVSDANYNKFGGSVENDNSGALQYIRIEYAGKTANPNDEVNGLSMYGVGSGTTVDHIEVLRGLDDAFEFFGGSFNAKYLIAYACADDDFDFDDGYHGNLQYLISIKDPNFTDTKTGGDVSNNLEWDNVGSGKDYNLTPKTHARISNLTAIGNNGTASDVRANYGYGARFRRGAEFEIANSVFVGNQLASFYIESNEGAAAYNSGTSVFKNNTVYSVDAGGPLKIGSDVTTVTGFDLAKMETLATALSKLTSAAGAGLTDPFNIANANVMPTAGSALLTAGTSFAGNFTTANGFDNVTYRGALGTTNWATGWTLYK